MSSIDTQRRLLTPDEVAARLGLSRRAVIWKIKRGQLPGLQLGGKRTAIRIDERELDEWLYSNPETPRIATRSLDDGSVSRNAAFF